MEVELVIYNSIDMTENSTGPKRRWYNGKKEKNI